MVRKAKRRGRPPGSKNKSKSVKSLSRTFAKLEVSELKALIDDLQDSLAKRIRQQRDILESQLEGLKVFADNKAGAAVRTVMRLPGPTKRKKAEPKYQSKKSKKLKWSGRGLMPVWMREEMKGTKLTKEDFAI
jgi:DNA-binding protein H-NS